MKRFVFLGLPGSGKGTFAKLICDKLNWLHLSVGDILRTEVPRDSSLGKDIANGLLISDDVVNKLVANKLQSANSNVILDGYPRNLSQADLFWRSCEVDGVKPRIIHIDLDEIVIVQKLLGRRQCATCLQSFNLADVLFDGFDMPAILPDPKTCKLGSGCDIRLTSREDDTAPVIRQRLAVYRDHTSPLLKYFEQKGVLRTLKVKQGIKDTDKLIALMLAE